MLRQEACLHRENANYRQNEMPQKPTDELSLAGAQFLMSQLVDGEIDPSDADRLHAYLERNPEAMAWMESVSLTSSGNTASRSEFEAETMRNTVLTELARESRHQGNDRGAFLSSPFIFRALASAAAVTLVASIAWFSFSNSEDIAVSQFAESSSVVEFVDTDLPDASPVVYTDSESGWTIVWIDQVSSDAG